MNVIEGTILEIRDETVMHVANFDDNGRLNFTTYYLVLGEWQIAWEHMGVVLSETGIAKLRDLLETRPAKGSEP